MVLTLLTVAAVAITVLSISGIVVSALTLNHPREPLTLGVFVASTFIGLVDIGLLAYAYLR